MNPLYRALPPNLLIASATGMLQVALPLYALSLGATTSQIGLIRGAAGIGTLLLVLPAGILVDRFGTWRLLVLGSCAGAAISLLVPMTATPLALLLLMLAEGFSRSLLFTSLSTAFFRSLERSEIDKSGWYKGSVSIGLTFVGPLLGGLFLARHAFAALFALRSLLLAGALLLPGCFDGAPAPGGADSRRGTHLEDFRRVARLPGIGTWLAAEALGAGTIATFITFIMVIAVRNWRLDAGVASLLVVLESVAFTLTVFLGGSVTSRRSQGSVCLAGILLSGGSLLCLSLGPGRAALALSCIALGLGLGLVNLVTSAFIAGAPGEKGKLVALFAAATGVGGCFGPLLGGLAGELFAEERLFWTYLPLFALLGLSVVKSRRRPALPGGAALSDPVPVALPRCHPCAERDSSRKGDIT